MRGAQHAYDPYRQTRARVEQLRAIGHSTDKVDFIVLGGTFTNFPPVYQQAFVKGCFDGLNGFESDTLEEAQGANETAANRMIGLTIETKPERFGDDDVSFSMRLGVTRVEFGVQSTFDDVLMRVNRGHTVQDVREATRRAKDAGLKVGYHMMPGLPGSDLDRDLASFRALFEDPDYHPDLLKVYPTLVLEGTALHGLWRSGRYTPLSEEDAVELVAKLKALVPPWCRIQRVQREIGAPQIRGGPRKGDLRILARERLRARGLACRCIRCREVGFRGIEPRPDAVELVATEYEASGGREVFLSIEDRGRDVLLAYLRLRIDAGGAAVREVRVCGRVVPFRERPGDRWQHRGLGRRLMAEAERIARDSHDAQELRVTSGVGARAYYRGLGYRLEGPHMVRGL